jgi:UV DNA damage endonuclease
MNGAPRRLGFPVKVMESGTHDSRRWENEAHLRVSLEYLDKIFDYLFRHRIDMYRMSSDLAPYVTHPDMPQFHGMIKDCKKELRAIGARRANSICGFRFTRRNLW